MPRLRDEYQEILLRYRAVLSHAESLDYGDSIRSELAKYLCVLAAGMVEAKLRSFAARLVRHKRGYPGTCNAAIRYADEIRNPSYDRLKAAFSLYTDDRYSAIEVAEETISAINSIMSIRHRLVHGRDQSVTVDAVKSYVSECERLFAQVDLLID